MTKRICIFTVILMLCLNFVIPTYASSARLVDKADLLTDAQESTLTAKLDVVSEQLQFDLVAVTTDDTEGLSTMAYADDFFDYNDYGYGESYDGALLLIDMQNREVWLSTSGYGITAFTDDGIEYITESVATLLGSAEYEEAISLFADMGEDFVKKAQAGEPYDAFNLPKEPFSPFTTLVISLVVGVIVGFIVTAVMKGKLKTVRQRQNAAGYQRPGSMNLVQSGDRFLYSTVTCTVIPKNTSSGSSTHTSSSGRTHGGGGARF